jgi:hypothetical protein
VTHRARTIASLTLIIATIAGVSSCSVVVSAQLFNDTPAIVTICDLSRTSGPCHDVSPGAAATFTGGLYHRWRFSISADGKAAIYAFEARVDADEYRGSLCRGRFVPDCRLALQLGPDGLVYWAGRDARPPVRDLPSQPTGFPLSPAA